MQIWHGDSVVQASGWWYLSIWMVIYCLSYMQGSVLYNYFTHGKLERSEGVSITEGIGQGRVTTNLQGAAIDSAMLILDEEAVTMVRLNHK